MGDHRFWPSFAALAVGLAGCLDAAMLADKQCDAQGRCLEGYRCDPDSNRCVSGPCREGIAALCEGDDLVRCDGIEVSQRRACPLGCQAGATDARCLQLRASNLKEPHQRLICASSQELVLSGEVHIDTDSGRITGPQGAIALEVFRKLPQRDEDAAHLGVFAFGRLEIAAGAWVRASGSHIPVFLACTEIVLAGVLDVSGRAGRMLPDGTGVAGAGGPGGFDGGDKGGQTGSGPGAGAGGAAADCKPLLDSGGAGAGFGGPGGAGGNSGDPDACAVWGPAGGGANGSAELVPLTGGSGGGGGGDPSGGPGGGGGGAVQLSANAAITVAPTGGLLAGGGAGAGGHDGIDASAGGGAGAGGGLLLEAARVVVQGTLAANGGAGGAGFGDNLRWSDRVAESGQNGGLNVEPAQGGAGAGFGGAGGDGSAGSQADGLDGAWAENGGGGGGGAGRIRIHTRDSAPEIGEHATISPSAAVNRCVDLCSSGPVETR